MDSQVNSREAALVQPPAAPPQAQPTPRKHPSELTDAEFFAILNEMTNGPAPNYVEGTFRREDIYGDESESDSLDEPIGYVTAPVLKSVAATFAYVGKLVPMPIPELDG